MQVLVLTHHFSWSEPPNRDMNVVGSYDNFSQLLSMSKNNKRHYSLIERVVDVNNQRRNDVESVHVSSSKCVAIRHINVPIPLNLVEDGYKLVESPSREY